MGKSLILAQIWWNPQNMGISFSKYYGGNFTKRGEMTINKPMEKQPLFTIQICHSGYITIHFIIYNIMGYNCKWWRACCMAKALAGSAGLMDAVVLVMGRYPWRQPIPPTHTPVSWSRDGGGGGRYWRMVLVLSCYIHYDLGGVGWLDTMPIGGRPASSIHWT